MVLVTLVRVPTIYTHSHTPVENRCRHKVTHTHNPYTHKHTLTVTHKLRHAHTLTPTAVTHDEACKIHQENLIFSPNLLLSMETFKI